MIDLDNDVQILLQHCLFLLFALLVRSSLGRYPALCYTVISIRVEIGKTGNFVETRRPQGAVFSYNFEFSQFPRVDITVYQYG